MYPSLVPYSDIMNFERCSCTEDMHYKLAIHEKKKEKKTTSLKNFRKHLASIFCKITFYFVMLKPTIHAINMALNWRINAITVHETRITDFAYFHHNFFVFLVYEH